MELDILRDTNINMFAENATHITLLLVNMLMTCLGVLLMVINIQRKK